MGHSDLDPAVHERRPWNAGQDVGPKRPLRPRDIRAIRFYLDEHKRLRDRALFDLAIDSKLRGCDPVKLRIGDLVSGGTIRSRATVIQQKTGRPVQFEIVAEARKSLLAWLEWRLTEYRIKKAWSDPLVRLFGFGVGAIFAAYICFVIYRDLIR